MFHYIDGSRLVFVNKDADDLPISFYGTSYDLLKVQNIRPLPRKRGPS